MNTAVASRLAVVALLVVGVALPSRAQAPADLALRESLEQMASRTVARSIGRDQPVRLAPVPLAGRQTDRRPEHLEELAGIFRAPVAAMPQDCPAAPDICWLAGGPVVSVGTPAIAEDRATVDVMLLEPFDGSTTGIAASTWRVSLRRGLQGWSVTEVTVTAL